MSSGFLFLTRKTRKDGIRGLPFFPSFRDFCVENEFIWTNYLLAVRLYLSQIISKAMNIRS